MNETLAKQKVTPKKMNATNARGLNAMKQKIKKNNKDFDDEIKKYRDDKDLYMESDDDEEELPIAKPKKTDIFITNTGDAVDTDDVGFASVGKGGRVLQYTPESILSHLRAINESRGRKIPTVLSRSGLWSGYSLLPTHLTKKSVSFSQSFPLDLI